jgi:glycosyltransferase involved in cell wall biosynthesis
VLQQIGLTDEIILVDDASTDETQKIIDRYALDPRIKSFKNRSNIGVVASFEKAILESSGSIIFLCDQDDIWLPNKVKHMSKCFEDTNVVAAVSDCELIDDVGNKISNSYFVVFVSEILFQYRRHGRNVTKMTPGSPFFILKKRLFYLRHLKFLKLIGKLVKLHLIS